MISGQSQIIASQVYTLSLDRSLEPQPITISQLLSSTTVMCNRHLNLTHRHCAPTVSGHIPSAPLTDIITPVIATHISISQAKQDFEAVISQTLHQLPITEVHLSALPVSCIYYLPQLRSGSQTGTAAFI